MYINRPQRKKDYDYNLPGAYFITICVSGRKYLFGEVVSDTINLSQAGEIVAQKFTEIPLHHINSDIGEFVIMPNHIHCVIMLYEDEGNIVGQRPAFDLSLKKTKIERKHERIPVIIGSYKSGVSREINKTKCCNNFKWQTSFYDHIIRNEKSLEAVYNYITANPSNWDDDIENLNYLPDIDIKTRDKKSKIFYKEIFVGSKAGL